MKAGITLLVTAAVFLGGCGPIEATALINDADVALTGARAAEAHKLSPYEFVSAELYLDKAREERGHAEFGKAIDYARKSLDLARQAETNAMKRLREGGAPQGNLVPLEKGDGSEQVQVVSAP